MVNTRHGTASNVLPPPTSVRRSSLLSHDKPTAQEQATKKVVNKKQPQATNTKATNTTQQQTLQHLASMMWEALDDDASASDDDYDDAPDNSNDDDAPDIALPRRNTDVDPTSLAWAPALQLDYAALPSPSSTSHVQKEAGLAGQQRALPRTHRPAPPSKASTSRAWFDLPAPEITDDVKRDLRLLRLRSAYDPTRHYKSLGKGKFPKNFAFGTVIQGPGEFFSERLTRKERKNTLAEQLLADKELTATRKKRFAKLQDEAGKWSKAKSKRQRMAGPPNKHRARPRH